MKPERVMAPISLRKCRGAFSVFAINTNTTLSVTCGVAAIIGGSIMGAGKYDHKLTLLKRSLTTNENNNQEEELFTPSTELWAKIENVNASLQLAYGARNSIVDVKIRI